MTEYINGLAEFFSNYVMMFAIYIVNIVVVTVFMLELSPTLSLIVFATVVPMMSIMFVLRKALRKMYQQYVDWFPPANTHLCNGFLPPYGK